MHESVEKMNDARVSCTEQLTRVMADMNDLLQPIKAGRFTDEQLCDMGWCFRRIEKIADELRKEGRAKADLAGKILAFRRITESLDDSELTVRGELATGTPKVRHEASIPKHGTPEYEELCNYFEIPAEIRGTRVVQFHYRHLSDWMTAKAEEGENVPNCLEARPVFSTTFTRKTRKGKADV